MADISNFNLGNGESVNFKDAAARTALDSKADKVLNATNGNFAGLDSNGNLTDSGKKASDFMASDGVSANPTGTATGDLTSIRIGGTKYNIPSGGGSDLPDGSTVTPTDDIQTWLACAGLTETYTTLNEVLADDDVMEKLFRSENASDYLVRSTTWASDITANQTAMILIGKNDYCANKLLEDSTWENAISGSLYWDKILKALIPIMTSNTTPYGVASAQSEQNSNNAPWKAFDGISSAVGGWTSATGSQANAWLQYDFGEGNTIKPNLIIVDNTGRAGSTTYWHNLVFKFQGSNDGTNFTDIADINGNTSFTLEQLITTYKIVVPLNNTTGYRYVRWQTISPNIYTNSATESSAYTAILEAQVYGCISKTTIYSAANDIVSFVDDEGAKVVTTDSTGKGEVSIVCKPNTDITFTSSIAKNPYDLSENYSKVVTVKSSAEPVYVMPNNALYWYGYQSSNCEDISTANGWSRTGITFGVPTHNTNNISVASGSSSLSGIGNKNALANYTKVHAIFKGNTLVTNNYGALAGTATKAISDLSVISLVPTDALTHVELTSSLSYISMFCMAERAGTIYALWYENGDDGNYDKADADLIAPVQKTLTAKKAYAVGEQFVYNQTLYRVAQAIAQGATITIGTNSVLAGSVTEQIDDASVIYSTTERKIGRWTTGEDLYEITLTKTEPSSAEHYIDVTSLNIKNVVYIDAVRIDSSANLWPANANRGNNPWGYYQYVGTSKRITFYKSAGTAWQNALLVCTIRYTKNS